MIGKIIVGLVLVLALTGCGIETEPTCEERGGSVVVFDTPDGICPEDTVDIGMTEILDCYCRCCK